MSSFAIDEAIVLAWAELSGDYNRLHVDEEFASRTRYGRRIAHGPILASYVSEWVGVVAGESWPTSGRISFRFRDAVFFPDTVQLRLDLGSVEGQRQLAEVSCYSGDERLVMTASASWDRRE